MRDGDTLVFVEVRARGPTRFGGAAASIGRDKQARLARAAARARLGIDQDARVLAILPGSRSSEIRLLAPRFLQAAQRLLKKDPALQCVVPMVNDQRRAEFQAILAEHPVPGLRCITADDLHGAGGDRKAPVACGRW
ncbi:hypothetical protein G6F57_020880 [Rhizopus arrhizus]|nr:hypothetical protein G6F57_020880 [Rhizopus arrhizus]